MICPVCVKQSKQDPFKPQSHISNSRILVIPKNHLHGQNITTTDFAKSSLCLISSPHKEAEAARDFDGGPSFRLSILEWQPVLFLTFLHIFRKEKKTHCHSCWRGYWFSLIMSHWVLGKIIKQTHALLKFSSCILWSTKWELLPTCQPRWIRLCLPINELVCGSWQMHA